MVAVDRILATWLLASNDWRAYDRAMEDLDSCGFVPTRAGLIAL
jgi:predicted dinucleotide-binding enzyme